MVRPQSPVETCASLIFVFSTCFDLICYKLNLVSAQIISEKRSKLARDAQLQMEWGIPVGRLDESVIEKDEEPKPVGSVSQSG